MDLAHRLAGACVACDLAVVETLFAPDVVALCDSGGRVPAVREPVHGVADVSVLTLGVLGGRRGARLTVESVNGQPGLVLRRTDGVALVVVALRCDDGCIAGLYIVLNPVKLRGWHRR